MNKSPRSRNHLRLAKIVVVADANFEADHLNVSNIISKIDCLKINNEWNILKIPSFVGTSLLLSIRDTAFKAARFLKQAANSCKTRAKKAIEPPYEITKKSCHSFDSKLIDKIMKGIETHPGTRKMT